MHAADLKEAIRKVDEAKADESVRETKAISVGEAIHQGDVYVHRMKDDYQVGNLIKEGDTQIVKGTTLGSRHFACGNISVFESLAAPEWLKVPQTVDWSQLVGPVVDAKEKWILKHPEHSNHVLPAGRFPTSPDT